MVSDKIKEELYGSNFQLFRVGSDEFVVVLPGICKNELWVVEQHLKEALINTTVPHFPPVLAAVGTAWDERAQSLQEMVKVADARMYEHKRKLKAGR